MVKRPEGVGHSQQISKLYCSDRTLEEEWQEIGLIDVGEATAVALSF